MKNTAIDSGERHVHFDLSRIPGDHIVRYEYAANIISQNHNNGFGLEVFCGTGYGSYLISKKTSAKLLAIDGSQESINIASQKYLSANLLFCQKFFPFNLPKSTFDFVISMESIEHVFDSDVFLKLLSNSLKVGGSLFLSAPNERVMPLDNNNKWHFRHFDENQLNQMIEENKLEVLSVYSTIGHEIKPDGKTGIYYPYQVDNKKLFDKSYGDTYFYHLIKR